MELLLTDPDTGKDPEVWCFYFFALAISLLSLLIFNFVVINH